MPVKPFRSPRRRRWLIPAVAFLAGAVVAGGGVAVAASLTASAPITLCLPTRGGVQVPVSGSCPAGTRKVQAAGQGAAIALAARVNAITGAYLGQFPPRVTVAMQPDKQGRGFAMVYWNTANLAPQSRVVVTVKTSGGSSTFTSTANAKGEAYQPTVSGVAGPPCDGGSASATIDGIDPFGNHVHGSASIGSC